MVPFVVDGLEAGEPVLVAVIPEHGEWLRDSLGPDADSVEFVDMRQLGRNPALIIPAWQEFLDLNSHPRRPLRGIGEPIWPGRRSEELLECQFHEALLNVAVDPEEPFWLVCPYDVDGLSPAVIEEAHRSHPVIMEADGYQGSSRYGGRAHVNTLFAAELAELGGEAITIRFTADELPRLLGYLKLELYVAGLDLDKAGELAIAVHRLCLGSVHRGSLAATLRIWNQSDAVVCEVADETTVDDVLHGRRTPSGEDHDGVWLANQTCDLVQVRSMPTGTTARVHAWKG